MDIAQAKETTSAAFVPGLMMGGFSFLFFFLVLRAGLIHVGGATKGRVSFLLLPGAVVFALGWKIVEIGGPLFGDRGLSSLVLFFPPAVLAISSSIPLWRLITSPEPAESASPSQWSVAAALPYGGVWYGVFTFIHLQ
ncbi:MAG: hypothetical protein U9P68_06005 [Pseudomonadota bacterium]|nr:hypothetical protein [Pseudomonadota bacterium]